MNSRNSREARREKVGLGGNKISNYINSNPHHAHELIAPKIKMWSQGSKRASRGHKAAEFLRGGGRGGERQAEGGGASLPSLACRGLEASPPPSAASTWLLPVFAKLPSPFPQGQSARKRRRRRRAKTTRQEGGLGWRARGEAKSEVGANVLGAGGGEDRKEQRAIRDKASEIAGERGMGAGHW